MAQTPYCTDQDVIDCCAWPRWAQAAATARARLIAAASGKVDAHCRRPYGFAQQVVAETLDGRGLSTLWLRHRPVVEVMSVAIDGQALDNTAGDAWTVDGPKGRLVRGAGTRDRRYAYRFPRGSGNVVVQYWGGYRDLPDQVVAATAFLVKYLYEQGKASGIYSDESIGDYSYTLREAALAQTVPPHVGALLADYVQDDLT